MAKKKTTPKKPPAADVKQIVDGLRPLAVPLDSLTLDPRNARSHDDRNLRSIRASLQKFGQRKPVVVNKRNGEIEAGNGTYLAAQELGWKYIAAVYVDDDPATQVGFSLSDKRTAELADWDGDVLGALVNEHRDEMGELVDDLLLDELLAGGEADDDAQDDDAGVGEVNYNLTYQVIVECKSEDEQVGLLERFEKEGLKCRALIT